MTKRMRSIVTAVAAIAALATGGAVFAQAQNGASTTPDQPTQQQAPDGEQGAAAENSAEKPGEEGSEVPNDDGPGGHADEPGNPNADHQFEGNE
jgi:uncharacterized protein HemX